jgi:hypothetical protein
MASSGTWQTPGRYLDAQLSSAAGPAQQCRPARHIDLNFRDTAFSTWRKIFARK